MKIILKIISLNNIKLFKLGYLSLSYITIFINIWLQKSMCY